MHAPTTVRGVLSGCKRERNFWRCNIHYDLPEDNLPLPYWYTPGLGLGRQFRIPVKSCCSHMRTLRSRFVVLWKLAGRRAGPFTYVARTHTPWMRPGDWRTREAYWRALRFREFDSSLSTFSSPSGA